MEFLVRLFALSHHITLELAQTSLSLGLMLADTKCLTFKRSFILSTSRGGHFLDAHQLLHEASYGLCRVLGLVCYVMQLAGRPLFKTTDSCIKGIASRFGFFPLSKSDLAYLGLQLVSSGILGHLEII